MAKIYCVVEIKPNQFKKMSIWSLTYQQSVLALSQWQTCLRVLPTRWRQKSTDIDMEQNYVTVTLCICRVGRKTLLHLFIQLSRMAPVEIFLRVWTKPTGLSFLRHDSRRCCQFSSSIASLSQCELTLVCNMLPQHTVSRGSFATADTRCLFL